MSASSLMRRFRGEILRSKKMVNDDESKILDFHEMELFEEFSADAIVKLKSFLTEKTFMANDYIFRMGEVNNEIYFIRNGNVKMVLPVGDSKILHLVSIGKGGIFGEMTFVDKKKRSADAVAIETEFVYLIARKI